MSFRASSRDSVIPSKTLSLTPKEKAKARQQGLTFSPRNRGRARCNQVPRLGVFGRRRIESLCRQVWPRKAGKNGVEEKGGAPR